MYEWITDERDNSPAMLAAFFESKEKPLTTKEFVDFWVSCDTDERNYYRKVDLKTGLLRVY